MDERGKRFDDKIEYARERIEDLENGFQKKELKKRLSLRLERHFRSLLSA